MRALTVSNKTKMQHVVAGGPNAAAALNERYMFSVVPSLAAWPIVYMHAGPGSLAAAFLLVRLLNIFL